MEYVIQKCLICHKKFSVMKWKLGQNRGKTCSKGCRHLWQKQAVRGEKSALWRGGFYIKDSGYKMIYSPSHPFKNGVGYVAEHRLVMEKHLKRFLKPTEVVHHINENKIDNDIKNLKLIENTSRHRKIHRKNVSCPCGKVPFARGLCAKHYSWYKRHSFHIDNFN